MQKVTLADLQNKVVGEMYWQPEGTTLTVCALTLNNGIIVTGDSACLNPSDFNADIGKKIAKDEAIDKLWFAEGYHRKQVYKEDEGDEEMIG
jgi:hypothetical protein